ncbi:GPI mannosyltransferase 3-like [Sinocyclocheilus rhinocerous]|uniref:GPI mannosyltransferase 3-like n=1 Tax=Sinocyclocheilus rhinocerous TaxID=307959 RepID=UPI0007B7D543|nr:PREDICTED: GPI mannosyltransferase 3-like [Sinocyclocheilus rhinocerous]
MEKTRERFKQNKPSCESLRKRSCILYSTDIITTPQTLKFFGISITVFSVVFRLLNCVLLQTSFVPDEYWQSLEIPHRMVFSYGYETWEWKEGIRGYSYPLLFALMYKLLHLMNYDTVYLLVFVPRVFHALLAACADVMLYNLVLRWETPDVAKWTYFCQLCSWFTWFCCSRTLTNTMETVLTTLALCFYPLPGSKTHNRWVILCQLNQKSPYFCQLCSWFTWFCCSRTLTNTMETVLTTLALCFYPLPGSKTHNRDIGISVHLHTLCSMESLLAHKEFRFVYPVLPFCMIFSGVSLAKLQAWRKPAAAALLLFNLIPALYTGLIHQRGSLDVMHDLRQLCDPSDSQSSPELLFLMPCHSTPLYSHLHCPLKLRFLECPPDLTGNKEYVDEADMFFSNPLHWLQTSFPSQSTLPSHIVLFDGLEKEISSFLEENRFAKQAEIFHTHFPEGRVGRNILIYTRGSALKIN